MNKRLLIAGSIIIALALIIKLIIYFSTGWTETEVRSFQVCRVSQCQWIAHYSGIDYEGDYDWWTDPASDIAQETYWNRYEDVTQANMVYPAAPLKFMDIDKTDLDEVKLTKSNSYFLISSHGEETLSLHSSYIEALRKWKQEEAIKAVYHHGEFWNYNLED